MHAHRVGQHRFDDVAVRACDPHTGAVFACESGVQFTNCRHRTRLHLREPLPAREDGGGRLLLDHAPQRFGQELLDRPPRPLTVVDLHEPVLDDLGTAEVFDEWRHRLFTTLQG